MSDFEEVELTTDVAPEKMDASDYAQVIFHNIAETYPTDANISCQYTITSLLDPSSRDWVGLYKVGWSSCNDYVYFEWAPLPEEKGKGKDIDCNIIFQASRLPSDDGEFYQFCYVTRSGHVRGASTPFQFKHPRADDFIEVVDDDHDVLIIKSRTVALEEDLRAAAREREDAIKAKELLEGERDSLLEKLVQLSRRLKEEQESQENTGRQLAEKQEQIENLEREAKDMTQANQSLNEKINTINQEKKAILKRLEENETYLKSLQDKIKSLINEKDALLGRCKMLEDEKELFKNHFTNSESTLQGYMVKIDSLQQKVESQETESRANHEEQQQLQAQLAQEKKKLENQMTVSKADKNQILDLTEKVRVAEDRLSAMEACVDMSKEEATAVKQAHDNMAELLEKAKTETHAMKLQCAKVEEALKSHTTRHNTEIERLTKEVSEKDKINLELQASIAQLQDKVKMHSERQESVEKEQQTGTQALYHLKAAQNHLKERYSRMKKERDETRHLLDEMMVQQQNWKERETDLKREIEDLKERLTMGADEYKTKYIECRRLQVELKKLQKQQGTKSSKADQMKEAGVAVAEKQTSAEQERTEAESQTSLTTVTEETEELADLTSPELQAQLDALGQELEQRHAKKQRYKQLYLEEKEKNNILKVHYYEELEKKQGELEQANCMLAESEEAHRKIVQTLKETIEKQKQEITQLKGGAKPKTQAHSYPPQSSQLPPIRYPDQAPPVIYPRQGETTSPLPYNPYLTETRPVVTPPQEPEEPIIARGACGGMTDSQVLMSDSSNSGASGGDDGCLPPPMEPEILPTAKLAAVKAACQGIGSVIRKLDPAPRPEDVQEPSPEILERNTTESVDGEEERFLDAEGEAQKICPVCNTVFPADLSQPQFEQHIDSHYGRSCPICQKLFTLEAGQDVYEEHVQSHFNEQE